MLSVDEKEQLREEWGRALLKSRETIESEASMQQLLGFEEIGSGNDRVVVLNDWLCDTSTWEPARAYLDLDTRTWSFVDLRGYGRSRALDGAFTIEEAAADVVALADARGWKTFTILGHSMSTLIALQLAQTQATRIERVVLLTPPPIRGFGYDEATHQALIAVANGDDTLRTRALERMLVGRLSERWLRFKLQRWRETSEPRAVAGYLAMFGIRGLPDPTKAIEQPVLAVTGEQDAPPMRSEAVSKDLAAIASKLTVKPIADSAHYPMQETPPLLASVLDAWL